MALAVHLEQFKKGVKLDTLVLEGKSSYLVGNGSAVNLLSFQQRSLLSLSPSQSPMLQP